MSRGDHPEFIYRDEQDCECFLATLAEGCQKTGWQKGRWHYGPELRDSAEAKAERLIQEASRAAGVSAAQLASWRKGHPFKVTLAAKVRAETTVTVDWIAQRLSMGSRGHLSHLLYKEVHAAIDQPTADQPTLRSRYKLVRKGSDWNVTSVRFTAGWGLIKVIETPPLAPAPLPRNIDSAGDGAAVTSKDASAIRLEVLSDYIASHSFNYVDIKPVFGAYCVETQNAKEASEVQKRFSLNQPPVECGTNQVLWQGRKAFAKRTGRKSVILRCSDIQVAGSNATAFLVAKPPGAYWRYKLCRKDDGWVTTDVTLDNVP